MYTEVCQELLTEDNTLTKGAFRNLRDHSFSTYVKF